MTHGYLDPISGEYLEKEKPLSKYAQKQQDLANAKYWDSLTEGEREIIKFCRTDAANKACGGIGIAQCRERIMSEFYRHKTNAVSDVKKKIKYEYCYEHFDEFKLYVLTNS